MFTEASGDKGWEAGDGWSSAPMSEGDAEAELAASFRRLGAAHVEFLGQLIEWEAASAHSFDGAISPASWLARRLGIGFGHAHRYLAHARCFDRHPELADSLRDGEISLHAALLFAEAFTRSRSQYAERDVALLLSHAARLSFREVRHLVATWCARVDAEISDDPAGLDDEWDPDGHRQRRLDLGHPCGGTTTIDGVLSLDGELAVRAALDAFMAGDGDELSGTTRTAAQRRHDALVGICRDFLTHGATPTSGGERPHVTVTIDHDVLVGRVGGLGLASSGVSVPAHLVRRLCCDAGIARAVMTGRSALLEIGYRARTFSGPLRRAITARDQHCRAPGCRRPPRQCDAHHVVLWTKGGPTSAANGCLMCAYHHRLVHEGGWRVTGDANHTLTFVSPSGAHHNSDPPARASSLLTAIA